MLQILEVGRFIDMSTSTRANLTFHVLLSSIDSSKQHHYLTPSKSYRFVLHQSPVPVQEKIPAKPIYSAFIFTV
jgi:hypothetical protein